MSNDIRKNDKINTIAAVTNDGLEKKEESDLRKQLAHQLMKESDEYASSSKLKQEEAQANLHAADALMQASHSVKNLADQMRKEELDDVSKIEKINEVNNNTKDVLEFPIPKDATPELLDQIAKTLEERSMALRKKADDLLKDSEQDEELSKKLKEQSKVAEKKEGNISSFEERSISSKNNWMVKTSKMLSVLKLDNEYKQQIVAAEQKGREIR